MTATQMKPEERARKRAKYFTSVMWHVGAFVILNTFFWMLDLTVGQGGLQWAYWITGPWAIALAFHVLAYFVDGSQLEQRKAREYLNDEGASGTHR